MSLAKHRRTILVVCIAMLLRHGQPSACGDGAGQEAKPTLELYGFAQVDVIGDFEQNDPDWYDVSRPTTLPAFADEFGGDGHFYLSPRQTRFGARSTIPGPGGEVKAIVEFDLFGSGPSAGLTAFHLRHAWGQWKRIGGGQTHSQFMDADVFPRVLDYWGPNATLFFRNVQVFWRPYEKGDSNATIAVENPGGSGDAGVFADRIELQNVRARFPVPDITGHYRLAEKWGHVQIGAAVRYFAYDDLIPHDRFDLSGHTWGGGVNLTSNLKAGARDLFRLQLAYGSGIETYLKDAPTDVAVKKNLGDPLRPVLGEALPVVALVAYLEHNWSRNWSSTIGYASVNVTNSDGQAPSAFRVGKYATVNLLSTSVKNVMLGGEFQWTERRNFSDGWSVNDYRLQFSLRFNFSYAVNGSQR